jgi:hypothetical protein
MTKTTISAVSSLAIILVSLALFFMEYIDSDIFTSVVLTGTAATNVLIGYFTTDASKTLDLSDPEVLNKITGSADDLKKVIDAVQSKKRK